MIFITRNSIMNALLDQLNTLKQGEANDAGVVSVSRKFKTWDQLSDTECPAIFIRQGLNDYVRLNEVVPAKTTLNADLFIYTRVLSQDNDVIPSDVMNDLLDAIDGLFVASAAQPQPAASTLGGIVSHCRIEGTVLVDTGDMDGVGLAIVPLKILIPSIAY